MSAELSVEWGSKLFDEPRKLFSPSASPASLTSLNSTDRSFRILLARLLIIILHDFHGVEERFARLTFNVSLRRHSEVESCDSFVMQLCTLHFSLSLRF